MAELNKVNAPVRKPLFEGVQGENEARSIQFDVTPWVDELGDGAVTATAKRSQDSQPYPVTVTRDGTTVTWKPTSTDTAFAGVGSFQLEYTVDSVLAKTCIWSTMVAPSLDPAGDPPDPYDNWLAEMRQIAADALQDAQDADASAQDAEAWAKGTKNGTPVPSTADQYENNAKYFAEESYKNAEAWAVGQRGGVDVPSTDPAYENNAKYWAEQSLANQYGAYIVKSASGEIASFSDGADDVPMKSLNVTITPKQSGSGDPSPSNVRPISGTSTADVHVTGINAWDEVWENGVFNTTTGTNQNNANQIRSKNRFPIAPNTEYYVSAPKNMWVIFFDADGNVVPNGQPSQYVKDGNSFACGGYTGSSSFLNKFTTPSNAYYMRFYCVGSYGSTYGDDISINYPSTDTEYHAYNGHTTPVPLGQTVYGANGDVVSGEWQNTMQMDVFDGDSVTSVSTNGGHQYARVLASKAIKPLDGVELLNYIKCDRYKPISSGAEDLSIQWVATNQLVVRIYDDRFIDAATAKQILNANPVHYLYPVRDVATLTTDPVSVPSLLGQNNVWSDAGAVEVEYRADPTLAYNELANVIVSLGGNI